MSFFSPLSIDLVTEPYFLYGSLGGGMVTFAGAALLCFAVAPYGHKQGFLDVFKNPEFWNLALEVTGFGALFEGAFCAAMKCFCCGNERSKNVPGANGESRALLPRV